MTTLPNCPKCGKTMRLQTKKGTTFQFYGCSNFPRCKGYMPFKAQPIVKQVMDFSGVKGTPQQNAFWQEVKDGVTHLILRARAGCGKTFTILYLLSFLTGLKIIFAAFNKHISKELQSKVPEGVKATTIHSFGFAQIRNWGKVTLDEFKLDGIIDEYVNEDDNTDYIKIAVKRLVELCKYNLIDGTNENDVLDLAYMHNIELNDHVDQVLTLVPQVIRTSKARKTVIDYTDMLWFIYAHNIPVEQFDVFICDEIQDLNPLQQYIIFRAIGEKGRFIGVGDDRQAIYGFAGADVYSIDNMIAKLAQTWRNVKVMPLTFTRRCPVSHVYLAQQIVPDIEAMPEAPIGSVENLTLNVAVDRMLTGDMGICRKNAPLIAIAYSLIRSGKSVIVRGRDIGKGLQALIKKLRAQSIPELIKKTEAYRSKEVEKLQARGKRAESSIQSLNDKLDTLIALTEGINDLSELRAKIDSLFSDNDSTNSIMLSSIHKAKGLEADRVFIFEYDKIAELWSDQEWQKLQTENLGYVAVTRSKDKLYLVMS